VSVWTAGVDSPRLQDAWKEFKIRRKEIKTQSEQNQSPAERNQSPAERNPNLTSFHESSLFNGLLPTLTGRPGKTGATPFATARTYSEQYAHPFVKKMSILRKAAGGDPDPVAQSLASGKEARA